MTKTKNFKKLITITLILSLLITPVLAIETTINIDYESDISTGEYTSNTGSAGGTNIRDYPLKIRFPKLEEWKQVKALIYELHYLTPVGLTLWSVRDIDMHTSQIDVNYKLGGEIISSGLMQFIRHTDSGGALTGGILTYTFDTPIVTALNGNQLVEVEQLGVTNLKMQHPGYPISFITHTNDCPWLVAKGNALTYTYDYFGALEGIGYKYSNFNHIITYDYSNPANNDIYLGIDKLGYTSDLTIKGQSDMILTHDVTSDNLYFDNLFDIPYNINITNPAYIGTGLGEYFDYTIPTDISTPNIIELSWYAYNKEATGTEVIGVNYDLQIRNETDLTWSLQTSGYNPSYLDLEIPNNAYYNMSLTAPDYEPLDNYTFSVIGDRTLSFGVYPEYGANFSVNFQVRNYNTGDRIEGAKIILNGITKYTPYNGAIGFGDISGYIEYEISKTGYVSLSGNKTITENTEMYIIMKTEAQILEEDEDDITPTPTPDITQPTNILESIQFGFQKMFGLSSSTEDMEISNLLMGLGIIFAGACLIATITKDALGAVVGGLIGFIMSLALGFIPLWVLFVGFAGFAIYIILTKTGGTE